MASGNFQYKVTMYHWIIKVYLVAYRMENLKTQCLGWVDNFIKEIQEASAVEGADQLLAELLYLKRSIMVRLMMDDSQSALVQMEKTLLNKEANLNDLLINKYYVKALLKYDEYELHIESKTGYQQLLKAQRIDTNILVAKH